MIPAHLQNALALDGVIDTGRVTDTPKPRRCPKCQAPTLAAIDEFGSRADTDRHATTILGEVLATLDGRRTFTVIEGGLVHRDAWRISRRDADREPAHVEHRCGSPPAPANPRHAPKALRAADPNQPPPF